MKMPRALLEEWMRYYYFAAEADIGSSGVQDYSMAEVRQLLGIAWEDLDRIVFHDSQTLGGTNLREAIADRWAGGDWRRVMATHGSSEANFLLMNALLEPGDDVIVADPIYPQLSAVAEAKGCRLRRWPLRFEEGFAPNLDELERLLEPTTRMVVVNFPQNPTGASLTPEEQRRLVEIVARSGAYLVWDNAFGEITYGEPPLPDPTALYERAISMGTLSKCFGLPGLRVGWCIAAPEVLERCILWRDYVTLHLSPLVETIAAAAISQAEILVGPRRTQARSNLEILRAWLATREENFQWVPPKGGVCVFPRLLPEIDVDVLCHRLAQEKKVLLVPGSCFGHPRHVRLGFGGSAENLQKGLVRLGEVLDTWRSDDQPSV